MSLGSLPCPLTEAFHMLVGKSGAFPGVLPATSVRIDSLHGLIPSIFIFLHILLFQLNCSFLKSRNFNGYKLLL